jgi:hypothetical protein
MMAMFGQARERSVEDFCALLASAGFAPTRRFRMIRWTRRFFTKTRKWWSRASRVDGSARRVELADLIDEPWALLPLDNLHGALLAEAFRSAGL